MTSGLRQWIACLAAAAFVIAQVAAADAQIRELSGPEIQAALTSAGDGDADAFLRGVRRLAAAHPHAADTVAREAVRLRPDLAGRIGVLAADAAVDPVERAAAAGRTWEQVAQAPVGSAAGGGSGFSKTAVIALVAIAVAGAVALAFAGGSGGGDDDGASPTPAPTPDPVPDPFGLEFEAQYGLANVNAQAAYDRGLTGAGVVVAVIDSGLDTTHPEFEGRITPGGINFLADQPADDVFDRDGHGTHVSGIIAANRDGVGMHGVAYESRILPIRIIDEVEGNTTDNLVLAVRHATAQGATVINGSYGPFFQVDLPAHPITATDATEAQAYIDAARQDVVLVFAAGNDGGRLPNLSRNPTGAGLFPYVRPANAGTGVYDDGGANFDFSELEGSLITVVAVDENNEIADFSNRCGVAADWCLAAPGVGIFSTVPVDQGSYGTISGTSQATPHVSGAVAILRELFPFLTGEQIVEILLRTATDLGAEEIYGHGLLNLEAATRPVGAASVPMDATVTGTSVPVTESRIVLGAAFGDALSAMGRQLAFIDDYDRAYLIDMAAFVGEGADAFSFEDAVVAFGRPRALHHVEVGDGLSLAFAAPAAAADPDALAPSGDRAMDPGTGVVSLTRTLSEAETLAVSYNVDPREAFGFYGDGTLAIGDAAHADALGVPYLAFAETGLNAHYTARMGEGVSWRVAGFYGEPDQEDTPVQSFGAISELRVALGGRSAIGLQMGALVEDDTFLGSTTEGAFATGRSMPTYFAGVTGTLGLDDRFSLVGSLHHGLSFPEPGTQSLFDDVGTIRSESYSLGVVGNGVFRDSDRLGLMVSQPLRVTDGSARITVPVGRDFFGNLYHESFDEDLSPGGREIAAQAFYHTPVGARTAVGAGLIYRHEPGHVDGLEAEVGGMLRLTHRF